jgi:hypothetical protein
MMTSIGSSFWAVARELAAGRSAVGAFSERAGVLSLDSLLDQSRPQGHGFETGLERPLNRDFDRV